jgi:hypothetical protein
LLAVILAYEGFSFELELGASFPLLRDGSGKAGVEIG